GVPFDVVLCCDPFRPKLDYEKLFPGYTILMQAGEDLGEGLKKSTYALLLSPSPVITIGTHCVALEPRHPNETAEKLASGFDLVLGPALDGGYYLIGMRKLYPEIFKDIAWSTDSVLRETRERADRLKLKVHELEPLADIDTESDLKNAGF